MIERCPIQQNGYYDVAASGVQTLQKRRKVSHQVVVALGSLTESSLCGNSTSRCRLKTFVSVCRPQGRGRIPCRHPKNTSWVNWRDSGVFTVQGYRRRKTFSFFHCVVAKTFHWNGAKVLVVTWEFAGGSTTAVWISFIVMETKTGNFVPDKVNLQKVWTQTTR